MNWPRPRDYWGGTVLYVCMDEELPHFFFGPWLLKVLYSMFLEETLPTAVDLYTRRDMCVDRETAAGGKPNPSIKPTNGGHTT